MAASLPWLTEGLVRQHSSADSFALGQEYEHDGAVLSPLRRGDVLQAEVEGSDVLPYAVRIELEATGITSAWCSCPYTSSGWCKHIVAVLLTYIHKPGGVEERPPLATLLSSLNRDQLHTMLLHLAERDSSLTEAIEIQITILRASGPVAALVAEPPLRRPAIDTTAIRRQVRTAIRSVERMSGTQAYYAESGILEGIGRIVGQAWELTRAGDGRSAIAILQAVTEEYVAEWELLDGSDGESGAFFEELGTAWAEAILSADLTRPERDAWAAQLHDWEAGVADYGVDVAFGVAALAAEQGWDDPALLRVLQGEITEQGAWDDEAPFFADELAVARLNVLERQGRFEEYLSLAQAESQTDRYVTMLAKLGRTADAVEASLTQLTAAAEALDVAQALSDRGEVQAALQVGERGLSLSGPKAALATWLAALASSAGQTGRALEASLVVLREAPDLAVYMRMQELAGDEWPQRRVEILERLRGRRSYFPQAEVDIFLREGLIDDAIAAVDRGASDTIVEQVVNAALPSHPDWVISACRGQAEPIMDGGKTEYYRAAAQWLAKSRDAYRATNRQDEWRTYLEEQIARHRRKYTLRPLLEALRK